MFDAGKDAPSLVVVIVSTVVLAAELASTRNAEPLLELVGAAAAVETVVTSMGDMVVLVELATNGMARRKRNRNAAAVKKNHPVEEPMSVSPPHERERGGGAAAGDCGRCVIGCHDKKSNESIVQSARKQLSYTFNTGAHAGASGGTRPAQKNRTTFRSPGNRPPALLRIHRSSTATVPGLSVQRASMNFP